MKLFAKVIFVVFLVVLGGCRQQQTFTDTEKEVIGKEVKAQFNQMVSAINQKDAAAWSQYYSENDFLSTIVGTDYYDTRSTWVDLITKHFSSRERQNLEPVSVHVSALTPELALLTSEEKSEMQLKDGSDIKAKHVFTILFKKEKDGWKIIHSHESWVNQ